MTKLPGRSIGSVVTELESEFTDISISKIRYLEAQGLVTPDRASSGYRRYTDEHVAQLRWVLRQQRDHFMPLRVIREQLGAQEFGSEAGAAVPAAPQPRVRVQTVGEPTPDLELSEDELLERTGIDAEHLAALEKFGLVEPSRSRHSISYDIDDLVVAQLAADFLRHGIEPRHLRPWRTAADREAGLVDQRMASVGTDPDAVRSALADLVDLGDDLRAVLLRRALRHHLR